MASPKTTIMIENIFTLLKEHCNKTTRDKVVMAIAEDGRLTKGNTFISARQYYIYTKQIDAHEAPIILEIVQNAVKQQHQQAEAML